MKFSIANSTLLWNYSPLIGTTEASHLLSVYYIQLTGGVVAPAGCLQLILVNCFLTILILLQFGLNMTLLLLVPLPGIEKTWLTFFLLTHTHRLAFKQWQSSLIITIMHFNLIHVMATRKRLHSCLPVF